MTDRVPAQPEPKGPLLQSADAGAKALTRDARDAERDLDALVAAGHDAHRRLLRRQRLASLYEQWSTFPMFVAAMLWLVAAVFRYAPTLRPVYGDEARALLFTTWCIFFADAVVRFLLDSDRRTFVRRYWPTLVALAVPPLRILLIVGAVRRISSGREHLATKIGLYSLYGLTMVVVIGALAVLVFEIDAPGGNIRSYGDATWWAIVTVVTVGYGDYVPVTVPGRVVAVIMMFAGVSVLSVVTAAVASRWIGRAQSEAAPDDTVTIADLQQQLTQIQAELARLRGADAASGADAGAGAEDGASGQPASPPGD